MRTITFIIPFLTCGTLKKVDTNVNSELKLPAASYGECSRYPRNLKGRGHFLFLVTIGGKP